MENMDYAYYQAKNNLEVIEEKIILLYGKNELKRIKSQTSVHYKNYIITKLSSGTIVVKNNNSLIHITKPVLRDIAQELGVSIYNKNGNEHITRQLGVLVIRAIQKLQLK